MITKDWKEIEGIQNVGEDDERVVGMRNTNYITGTPADSIQIAFCAFGGLKVIEIEGVRDVCSIEDVHNAYTNMKEEIGDDFEVAVPIVTVSGRKAFIAIDSSGDIVFAGMNDGEVVPDKPTVTQVDEYDAYEMEDLDYELLEKFDFA